MSTSLNTEYMGTGFNKYTTEQAVQAASLIDMTKDVFAPGPDGRVAVRMIHEGEYLGGPVAGMEELNAINSPIVGEFHFVIDLNTWGVWSGTEWEVVGGTGPEELVAGEAIRLVEDGLTVAIADEGSVAIHVKYDPDEAVDLFAGLLGVKTDDITIIKNATGHLEFSGTINRTFYPVETVYDIYGRPISYKYDIDGEEITTDITYTLNGLRARVEDSTGDIYDAAAKTYNYNTITRTGTLT